jgi:predicted transport protein
MKLTSDRQGRWAKELIERLATENGWQILEKPDYADVFEDESEDLRLVEVDVDALKANDPFAKFRGKRGLTFKEKLAVANEGVLQKYQEITETLTAIERVRVADSRRFETYKRGNTALARIAIKGKTLNVYLGLDPKDYEDTKYIFTDESDVKAFERYPMRVKVTSARKAKWVKELIAEIVEENGLTWKGGDDV